MLRRLFNFLTIMSLVLWVATVVLWMRSYSKMDAYVAQWSDRQQYAASSHRGTLWLTILKLPKESPNWLSPQPAGYWSYDAANVDNWSASGIGPGTFGFVHSSLVLSYGTAEVFALPHWFACASLIVLPLPMFLARMRRRLRSRSGLCLACGYDLRATPELCPECGRTQAQVRHA